MRIKEQTFNIAFSIFAFLLFCYVAFRTFSLSFTHDESLSFTIIEGSQQWLNTTNNHLLNTKLSELTSSIFGNPAWALRLPNLLSFALFLLYGFLFLKNYSKNKWAAFIAFPIIFLNPLALDFFGLFRGYGLALAFLMASLYHFIRLIRTEKLIDQVLGIAFGVLSIYSNYSFIVPALSIWLTYGLFKFYQTWPKVPFKEAIIFFICSTSLIPATLHIKELQSKKQIFFGGKSNALSDTFLPSLKLSFPHQGIDIIIWGVIILFFGLMLWSAFAEKKKETVFLTLIISSLVIAPSLAFLLLEINFAPGRAGTYWVLFLGISILFISGRTENGKPIYSIFKQYVPILISLLFLINFLITANISHTIFWKYDANTKSVLEILDSKIADKNKKYKLGTFWLYEPTLNFYRKTKNHAWLIPVKRENGLAEADYYYLATENLGLLEGRCTKLIHYFEDTNTHLLEACPKIENQ